MHPKRTSLPGLAIILVVVLVSLLAGCDLAVERTTPTGQSSPQISSTATLTQPAPTVTPTPEPLALRVNGEGIPLAEFEAQLAQIQAADAELGVERQADEQRQMALAELVDQTLLARAASQAGFDLNEADLDARIAAIKLQKGDEILFTDWLTQNGYTESSYRSALTRSIRAAWQRDRILADVPDPIEQVKARQILVRSRETAERVLSQLNAGANFADLAFQYDPLTGGDLGWFPRGYLTRIEVELAAFALQPGEFSEIIETEFGYHLLQVVERDTQRALSPEARLTLQQQALEDWLKAQHSAAAIEILLP